MRPIARISGKVVRAVAFGVLMAGARLALADDGAYQVRKLVSDVPGAAEKTDPHLVNAWGLAFIQFGPAWVADNGTGVSTIYDGDGNPQSLVVIIPGGKPTGIVFNGTGDFVVSKNSVSAPARFLFATENGTIAGWAPTVDPNHAITIVDNSASGAIYKGLTLGADGTRSLLYASDFHNNKVDVFDKNFASVTGGFTDSSISDKYAPFGIQNLGGSIYVTYAKQDADKVDEVPGRGNGIVNVFDARGNLIRRVYKGGPLNAPWGLAIAPADFGVFSNTLLVGNFGDGTINAFKLDSGRFVGTLSDANRDPIVIDGLWGIGFGDGYRDQPTNVLFFAAGPEDESHGLYGRIAFAP
jgi:uncharacterized protein (TIGR03118 family)